MRIFQVVVGAIALAVGVVLGQVLRSMGFTVYRPTPVCDGPASAGCGPNPLQCGTSRGIVLDPAGKLAEYADCGEGPHTMTTVATTGNKGLDADARAELMFAPARDVEVTVIHFGNPGRIEAYEMSGALAGMVMMGPASGVEQTFKLHGAAIGRIVVIPGSAADHTLVIGWCH